MKRMTTTILMLIVILAIGASAAELTVRNAARETDGKIREISPYATRNFGGAPAMATANSSGNNQNFFVMFQFLDTIGANMVIDTFQAIVYCEGATNTPTVGAFQAFKPYKEGTANNAEETGACCYDDWYFNSDAGLDSSWTTAGCMSASDAGSPNRTDASGSDRRATAFASVTYSAAGSYTYNFNAAGIQWANDVYNGDIAADQAALFFRETSTSGISTWTTSEGTTAANRPAYRVVYHSASTTTTRLRRVQAETTETE
jgi:hypothetical protein